MRAFIVLYLLIQSFLSSGQTITFNVAGLVKNTENAKFAYLTTLSQQIPISSDKIFMVTPIKSGKFNFNGNFSLQGKDFQYACVIIDERGDISKDELQSKFKELIWVTGREENIRIIILENIKLDIQKRDETITAKIITGGVFTKQRDELDVAVRSRNKKVLEFIKKYPDSPLSFTEVEETAEFISSFNKDKIESRVGSLTDLYNALSNKIRLSNRGLALKKIIVEKSNL